MFVCALCGGIHDAKQRERKKTITFSLQTRSTLVFSPFLSFLLARSLALSFSTHQRENLIAMLFSLTMCACSKIYYDDDYCLLLLFSVSIFFRVCFFVVGIAGCRIFSLYNLKCEQQRGFTYIRWQFLSRLPFVAALFCVCCTRRQTTSV